MKHAVVDDPLVDDHGFQPKVWGPPLWFFLHMVSINFPVHPTREQQMQYYTFFKSLGYVLPCRLCRESYAKWFETVTVDTFESRTNLSRWVYDLHNKVNVKIGKPYKDIPSYEEVIYAYNQFRGGKHGCPKFHSHVQIRKQ